MKYSLIIEEMTGKHPELIRVKDKVAEAGQCLITCYQNEGKVLVCGNGGSCSDSDHIVGELMKGFEQPRSIDTTLKSRLTAAGDRGKYLSEKLQKGLPAISLTAHNALVSAVANDIDPDLIFAQQVIGYGQAGDVLIGISTSGNSQNVIDSIITAKAKGMTVIGITGETGGKMKSLCDILINVPGTRTSNVQELHLPVYHALCRMVENHFF